MRHLAAILLALAASACSWPASAEVWDGVHATAYVIDVPGGRCSATAVGRYSLLTAAHCFTDDAGHVVKPDSITANGQTCQVWRLIDDSMDHVLLTVGGCEFKHWAKRGHKPRRGDRVFCWGNPGDFRDLLRFGVVAGESDVEGLGHHTILVDLNAYMGDSGSAIFNMRGEIVGVLSIGTYPYRLTGYFPLAFLESEWPKG